MDGKDILKRSLSLKHDEKFIVIEGLLKSLREPNKEIEKIWAEEAEKRL